MKWLRVAFWALFTAVALVLLVLVVALGSSSCTFPVTVGKPDIKINCIEVILSPDLKVLYCDDAGVLITDAGAVGILDIDATSVTPTSDPTNDGTGWGQPLGCTHVPCKGPQLQ